MERADVLIVGGGPAGSACAAALTKAGRDVLLIDAAAFPRDKPCAGWITPEVLDELPFPLASYAERHVVQPISRFRVGTIGGRCVDVGYGAPVSFGIRRVELDAELLRRSGARVVEGERVRRVERRDGAWVLDGRWSASTLVGAGGHFCPVAGHLGGTADGTPVVVAREVEFPLGPGDREGCRVEEDRPELYFCRDLRGYGWCFRKEGWLNVGLGRLDPHGLPGHLDAFLAFLLATRRLRSIPEDGWRGHAYRVRAGAPRRLCGDGFVLVGDAAGLASPASGEGILPALVSGRLAAEAILASRLREYPGRLDRVLGAPGSTRVLPRRIARIVGPPLFAIPWFARRRVLDRAFLHRTAAARA
ncbi:MAG TPA: FAD-dependent oxidoreductase [Candidatus Polarisedimenticolaceae bacterium]